jgi:hypothetical protein
MGNTLLYVGTEKPIINIKRYQVFRTLVKKNFITLTTAEVMKKHSDLPNPISFDSRWLPEEIEIFHLNLLWNNFLSRRNVGLNIDLRSRFLGPLKLKNLSTLIQSLGYLRRAVNQIEWKSSFRLRNSSSNLILKDLRTSKKIGDGDVAQFRTFLINKNVSNVISFSSFRDPKLYDLVVACNELKVDIFVFVECWDNISTAYSIPSGINKIYLWSKQQKVEIENMYPEYTHNSEIAGGYRINKALNFVECKSQAKNFINRKFRILYLEGYFYENLNYVMDKLIDLLVRSSKNVTSDLRNLEITIRKYPLKRQSLNSHISMFNGSRKITTGKVSIDIKESRSKDLYNDFQQANLVISELTTAGLEAAFSGLPVIFVSSKKSPRFLDSSRGYRYTFAHGICDDFFYVQFQKFFPKNTLSLFHEQIWSQFIELGQSKKVIKPSKELLNYYAEPFDFQKWNTFISNLTRNN